MENKGSNKNSLGDIRLELAEIEKVKRVNCNGEIDIQMITYGNGGFLTIICCHA